MALPWWQHHKHCRAYYYYYYYYYILPHDSSCLSVASIVQYVERKFRFRFTAAYSSNLFCSLLFVVVVHAGCNKLDHWCVAVCAVNCTVAVAFVIRSAAIIDPTARYLSRIAIFAYPACIWRFRQGVPVGIVITFGVEKLEWWFYQTVKKVWEYVYSFRQNSRTCQTDGLADRHRMTV